MPAYDACLCMEIAEKMYALYGTHPGNYYMGSVAGVISVSPTGLC
jgi:hypothetical protein